MRHPTLLAVGFAGALLAATVEAQTIPYQSSHRGTVGTGLGQSALPQGGQFEPRVEAAIQYVSNLNLATNSADQVNTAGIELAPGFYASLANANFSGAIDYSLIGRAWDESAFNDVSHRLFTNGQWLAVPDWFAIGAQGTYEDGVIDPRAGANYGSLGVFGPQYLEERATASVNPTLRHRFSDVEFSADYRYGRVWYLNPGKGVDPAVPVQSRDSIDQTANLSVGTAQDNGARVYGTLYYDWSRSEYDQSLVPYEFERAGIDGGARISRTLWLVAGGGLETDIQKRVAQGGLDQGFWNAGLRWAPDERTSAEARYGDRSFGKTYSFEAHHRSRLYELDASYTEEPTVETQRLSLGDITPGQPPPGVSNPDLGIFNSLPYVRKDGNASVRAIGSKTTLGLTGYWERREYLATQRFDETNTGASFLVTRHLASNLSADFDTTYRHYLTHNALEGQPDAQYDDLDFTLRLNRVSSKHLTMSAETGYLQRTGDLDYDGWWVAMRARWTP